MGYKTKQDDFEISKKEFIERLIKEGIVGTTIIIPFRTCNDVQEFLREKKELEKKSREKEIYFDAIPSYPY